MAQLPKLITYLPYPSFPKTASILHDDDLALSRASAIVILRYITQHPFPHLIQPEPPAVRMWRGFAPTLINYGQILSLEWLTRGHQESYLDEFATLQKHTWNTPHAPPWWLYLPALSNSHQSSLLAHNRPYYRVIFTEPPTPTPLFWPVGPNLEAVPF